MCGGEGGEEGFVGRRDVCGCVEGGREGCLCVCCMQTCISACVCLEEGGGIRRNYTSLTFSFSEN